MTRAEILTLQQDLNARGYELLPDGVYGPNTAKAYQDWLNQHTPQDMATPAPAAAKPWYLSRSILGILASALAVVAERMGWIVDANELTTLAVQVIEVAGLAVAFIGTVRNRAPIDPTLVAPGLRYHTNTGPVSSERRHGGASGPFGF